MRLTFTHATVLTLNAEDLVLQDACVRSEDGIITAIGRGLKGGGTVIDARGLVLMPGLVHGHVHVCQTLFRGRADGLELLDWLRERIYPMEAAHTPASLRASADLGFLEMIRSGATAALDMGTARHQDAIFESARDAGFRLTSGKSMVDAGQGLPRALRETGRDALEESLRLAERWDGQEGGRLRYAFCPRFALSCTEPLLEAVAREARARGLRIHTHAAEHPAECDAVRAKTGTDSVAYLHRLGLAGPHVTLAHCVWLTAEEHRLLRESGTCVCHCPTSNLKLGSGIAKVPELLAEGVPVSLGSDGAACNDTLDLWAEMRLAALLPRPRLGPAALTSGTVLRMATQGGARALGMGGELGVLEVGRRADVIAVDLGAPHAWPPGPDLAGTLVHAGRASDVRHVVIDGRLVMRDRQVLTLDAEAVCRRARIEAARIAETVA